jgi:hypothetical protein
MSTDYVNNIIHTSNVCPAPLWATTADDTTDVCFIKKGAHGPEIRGLLVSIKQHGCPPDCVLVVLCSYDTMDNTALYTCGQSWSVLHKTAQTRDAHCVCVRASGASGVAEVLLIATSEVTTTQCTFSHASFVYLSSLLSCHTCQCKILRRSAMQEFVLLHV